MVTHFDYEQSEFLKIPNFEEYSQDHINKHNNFLAKLRSHSVPLECDFLNYLKRRESREMDADKDEVLEYSILVWDTLAKRMLLYRPS